MYTGNGAPGIGERQRCAIKGGAWDFALGTYLYFDAMQLQICALLGDQRGYGAVTATDIEHGGLLGDSRGESFREDADTAIEHQRLMPPAHPGP